MELGSLVAALGGAPVPLEPVVLGDPAVDVTSVAHDSRVVGRGALFCCVRGEQADGHDHAAQAIERGAVALVVDHPLSVGVPQVVVSEVRPAMGPLASSLAGRPSAAMDVVGITGTNGKTTTAHLVHHLLGHAGRPAGLIGTLTGSRTTPEAPDLQRLLADFRDEGCAAVAMEVSSHALRLHRVDGTRFRVAVFTNLGQDHLDFHEDLEDYFASKASLFADAYTERALVNRDDAYGRRLIEGATVPTTSFGIGDAEDLRVTERSATYRWRGRPVVAPLGGRFNVLNELAAAEAVRLLGVDDETIADGLASAPPVPGRFELVEHGQPFTVVIDYAHTPDGLAGVLAAAREVTRGDVAVVFGCGGERDASKRPLMGEVASRRADALYLTSDNPRTEDPEAIIDDVRRGIDPEATLVVELDRRAAITAALDRARPGDVVVIAGKGHEATQDLGPGGVVPFDDRAVAIAVLEERGGGVA